MVEEVKESRFSKLFNIKHVSIMSEDPKSCGHRWCELFLLSRKTNEFRNQILKDFVSYFRTTF